MTNNTIPNVPREMLEELRDAANESMNATTRQHQIDHFAGLIAKADVLLSAPSPANHVEDVRAMVAAPSPAGVDGLEVETYLHTMHMELGQTEQFCSKWKGDPFGIAGEDYSSTYSVTSEPLCRLSDARAIIDGLRGEVERLQMQLAACGVVALANTIESAGEARQMHPDYMSASCSDVAGAVDREIALRTERDQQAQRIGELAELASQANVNCKNTAYYLRKYRPDLADICSGWCVAIDAALSAGKDSVS